METSDFDFENLTSIFDKVVLENISDEKYKEILVAYSGGIDSTALLYLANKFSKKHNKNIKAIHVNHNINIKSKNWENHCQDFCNSLNIPLIIKSINIEIKPGQSLEERAREERYKAINSSSSQHTLLMTGHHIDDQVETFFYNLLRGSGTKGLSAMPILKENLKGFHMRPILSFNKTALIDLVKQMNFDYINDDSNENMNFSRNYIREKILPVIKKKWPNYNKTVDRAILNLTNAQKLCSDLALIDLKKYKIQNKDNIISINVRDLDDNRFYNVIRYWIEKNNFKMPSRQQIDSIKKNVFHAGIDKNPIFSCSSFEIRRHKEHLEIMSPLKKHDPNVIYKWKKSENLVISGLEINLSWQNLEEKLGYKVEDDVEVKFRKEGENIKINDRKSLKDYMREQNIPPWKRDRVMLIYIKDELKVVWDKV